MLSKPQGIVRLEGLDKFKKFNDLIGNRTLKLPACRAEPQPQRYRVSHVTSYTKIYIIWVELLHTL
jgi:hypothetical protein